MSLPIKIAALSYESMSGRVHARKVGVQSTVGVGISNLELGLAESSDESHPKELVVIDFTHNIIATDESGGPFYEATVAVKAFLEVDRSVYPLDSEPAQFLDHALSLLMPMSAQKLRTICFELGVNPTPKITVYPIRSEKTEQTSVD